MSGNIFTSNGFVCDEAYEAYSALYQHQPVLNLIDNWATNMETVVVNIFNWADGTQLTYYISPYVRFCLLKLS